jgi:protein-L-isoaspartate(D-aspartate) O-methyltransferase
MTDSEHDEQVRRLMDEIRVEAAGTEGWTGRAAFSAAVMAAMETVPREEFVPAADKALAYWNRPLPIGFGQTISQPYIVALMTDLLDLTRDSRVLEIGTGCGYQAAILAEVAGTVYSVEAVDALAETAAERLKRLGYANVRIRAGDGRDGWPEEAPFDGIIVTAAAERIPPALIDQLAPGGRMVIPVGPQWGPQVLVVGAKDAEGRFESANTLPVAFVPLVHKRADERRSLF